MPEDEQQFLIDLNEAGFSFHQTIPVNERKDWYISYDFHILNQFHHLFRCQSAQEHRIWRYVQKILLKIVDDIDALICFLLVDLKTSRITHEDIGQMDMYIRMYDELKCSEGDNPTIGLLLCSETSKDLARYSILKDSKQLYAAKYLTYLPTKEQLTAEIEHQKEIFVLQTGKYQD